MTDSQFRYAMLCFRIHFGSRSVAPPKCRRWRRAMASAEGGEQTSGRGELVVPHGAQEQQQPGAGGLAEPDGQQVQGGGEPIPQEGQVAVLASQVAILMPQHITIGTAKAYEKHRAYNYTIRQVNGETIYACDKGSDCSRHDEYLVLRRQGEF